MIVALLGLSLLCVVPAMLLVPSHPFLAALGFLAAYVAICWVALRLKDAVSR